MLHPSTKDVLNFTTFMGFSFRVEPTGERTLIRLSSPVPS